MVKRVLIADDHNEDISDISDISDILDLSDDEFSDKSYEISKDDLRDEKEDKLGESKGVSNAHEVN